MLQGLIDTKKESIEFLQDTFSAPISERIYEICLQCQKLGLREFQKELCSISKWNNFTIEEETNKIITKSGCDFLPKMLKIVILSSLKIKFYEYSRKVNTLKIKIPSSSDFLHKCLINVAEFAWKHSYLFAQKNMKAVEIQNNMNEIEHSVRNIIAKTISEYLNVKYVVDKLNHLIDKHIQAKTKKKPSRTSRESEQSEIIEKHIYKSDEHIDNDKNDGHEDEYNNQERDNEKYDDEDRDDDKIDQGDDADDVDRDDDDVERGDAEGDDVERGDDKIDESDDADDAKRDDDNEIFENHFNKTLTEIEATGAIEKYGADGSDDQEESDEDLSHKDDKEVEQQELTKEENDISKFKSDSDSSEESGSSESDSDLESEPNPDIKIVKINDSSKRKFF